MESMFWMINTGFQSRPDIQNTHHEETGVSSRSTQFSDCIEITPVKLNDRTVFMLTLPEPASPVDRAFRHVAPSVWNAHPAHLTDVSQSLNSFKKQLKAFLYSQAYRQ